MNFSGYTAYLDGSLVLSKYGQWWHKGQPFKNQKLSTFFHRSIIWEPDLKKYMLEIGPQRATFTCEDTAFFVTQLMDQEKPCKIKLADESCEILRADSLRLGAENQIYCRVKNGEHLARFGREAYQALLSHAQSDDTLCLDGQMVLLK